jgi:phospholipid transport system substrate-binding protein
MKRHLFAFFAAAFVSVAAYAQSAPIDVVRTAVEGTVKAVKADPTASGGDIPTITKIVEAKFLPATNFDRTARIAAGDAWKQASPQQQQEISKQFTTLMTRTYAASLAQVGSQDVHFTFTPSTTSADDAVIASTVITPGDSQNVAYRLSKVDGVWKIYDIDLGGAWLIQVYQGQYKSRLDQGGVDGLINFLKEHNERSQ